MLTATEFMTRYGLKKDTYSRYKAKLEKTLGVKVGTKQGTNIYLSPDEQKQLLEVIPSKLIKSETVEAEILPVSNGKGELTLYIEKTALTVPDNSDKVTTVLTEQVNNLNAFSDSLEQLFSAASLQGKAIGQRMAVETLTAINQGYFETLNQGANNLQSQVTKNV